MDPPLVSVIVPAYNQGHYIKEAILSVKNQAFSDWECIIIDDGSTDDTRDIVRSFESRDNRFKYNYQENQGLSNARNNGIKVANGTYFAFLDSDDAWVTTTLQVMIDFLQKHPNISLAIGGYDEIDEQGTTISMTYYPPDCGRCIKELLAGNISPVHSILVKKDVFEKCGVFDPTLTSLEDWDMWLRASAAGFQFGQVRMLVAHYRVYQGSMSYNAKRMEQNFISVLEKFYNSTENKKWANYKSYSYALLWCGCAYRYRRNNLPDEMKRCLSNSIDYYKKSTCWKGFDQLIKFFSIPMVRFPLLYSIILHIHLKRISKNLLFRFLFDIRR